MDKKKNAATAIALGKIPAVQIGIYTECEGVGQVCVVCSRPIVVKQSCACAEVAAKEFPMHPECMHAWQEAVHDGAVTKDESDRTRRPKS